MLAFALNTAWEAGRVTLRHFQTGAEVDYKTDSSPVTIADRDAEQLIRDRIAAAYPTYGILGEEHGEAGNAAERWVIDPIDGTKSFISGVPLYATLLSFERDGVPEIGVCFFPALGEMIYAERSGGAYFNGRPCRVSQLRDLSRAVLACGSHASMRRHGREAGLMALAERALATRTWSDAYGHALVATGRVAAMIDPIVAHWDLSAVSLIVTEAGGRFTDFAGRPGIHHEAISSNGLLHDEILGAFAL